MNKLNFIYFLLTPFLFCFTPSFAQCTFEVEDYDNFEYSTVIPGYITGTTYHPSPSTHGSRTGTKGMYMNFVNGLASNTTVLDRTYDVCIGTQYKFNTWFKEINGGSSTIEARVVDAVGNLLATYTNTFFAGGAWTQWTTPTFTPTTNTIQFQIIYITGVGNNDFGMDDLTLEICAPTIGTSTVDICASNNTFNLFDSLNASLSTNGTWTGPSTPYNGYLGTFDPSAMQGGMYTYTLTSTGLNCPDTTAEVNLVLGGGPLFDLGDDTNICVGDVLTLDASSTNASYVWNNGSTAPTLSVNQTGLYWVEASDSCAIKRDSVMVTVNPYPTLNLGADTAVCDNDTLILNASLPNATYNWSTNTTDSAIAVTQPGWYFATVTVNNCASKDTIQVTFNPDPVVDLGNDTTFCQGNYVVLNAMNNGASYLWSDNSTNQVSLVNSTGQYWVEVNLNNCFSSDTVNVTVNPLPIALLEDTSMCEGDILTLSVAQSNVSYLWNDGSTGATNTVSQTGNYSVEITNNCGAITDQAMITFHPIPLVQLGNDTVLCNQEELLLSAEWPGSTYIWSTGDSSANLNCNSPGVYAVTVTSNNCTQSDTVLIDYVDLPESPFKGDTLICASSPLIYAPDLTLANYSWGNGNNTNELSINTTGMYYVTVSNDYCEFTDSISITVEDCDVAIEMPNIFTPNDDGQNDVFAPILFEGVQSATLSIFNRWGQLIATRNISQFSWNGKNEKGEDVPTGVYFWTIRYSGTFSEEQQSISGTVSLLR